MDSRKSHISSFCLTVAYNIRIKNVLASHSIVQQILWVQYLRCTPRAASRCHVYNWQFRYVMQCLSIPKHRDDLRMLYLSFSLSLSLSLSLTLPLFLYLYLFTSLSISMYVCCNKIIRMQHREWMLCVIIIERKLHCVNFRNIINYAN